MSLSSFPETIFSITALKPEHQTETKSSSHDIPQLETNIRLSTAMHQKTLFGGERHMDILGQRASKFMSNFPIMLYNISPTVSSALWL